MNPTAAPPRVILRHLADYDPARVRAIVREGIEELDLRPAGRVLVKPNLVAAGPMFPHAHTRAEVGEGVLLALRDVGGDAITELAVGERCGITIPTRMAFAASGFDAMARRVGAKRYYFEEEKQVEIPLTHAGRLRDYLFTPEPVARADFFVNVPKFKAHPWTTVTFSMKNYIGIQDDRHRLIDHDHRLNEKVADLQHVIQPQLIVIDAVIAGEGRMLTPKPFDLKLLILGNNQVAFDAACCEIIGVRPRDVEHVRLAEDRGFGTTDLARIAFSGDVSLAEARARGRGFEVGLIRADKYFQGTKITAYAGAPPEAERSDYCWGGCPGAIEEAIEVLRRFDSECDETMPRMHIVFGRHQGPIDARPGEKVLFIGDCAEWEGKLQGELVQVRSRYRDRRGKDPHRATAADIYAKMVKVTRTMSRLPDASHVRLDGCPVSVAEQVLALVELGGMKNPYFDPRQALGFNKAYLTWRLASVVRRLRGRKYQEAGPCQRGQAAPKVEEPGG